MSNPLLGRRLMFIGVFAMVIGFVLPFLMVIEVIKSTFFLNFLAFGSSVSGLFMGIIGIATYTNASRKQNRE